LATLLKLVEGLLKCYGPRLLSCDCQKKIIQSFLC